MEKGNLILTVFLGAIIAISINLEKVLPDIDSNNAYFNESKNITERVGQKFPLDLEFLTLNQTKLSSKEIFGENTLVLYFQPSCDVCIKAVEHFNKNNVVDGKNYKIVIFTKDFEDLAGYLPSSNYLSYKITKIPEILKTNLSPVFFFFDDKGVLNKTIIGFDIEQLESSLKVKVTT